MKKLIVEEICYCSTFCQSKTRKYYGLNNVYYVFSHTLLNP